jgi:hypothetical protein
MMEDLVKKAWQFLLKQDKGQAEAVMLSPYSVVTGSSYLYSPESWNNIDW